MAERGSGSLGGHDGRLIFVESNTTGSGMLALRKAAALGLDPLFVTADPQRYAGLAETGCEVLVGDTNSLDLLLQTLRKDVGPGRIAGVLTTSEFYLVIVAEIALALGLQGNPPAAMRACRDKTETRRLLKTAGLGQPRFAVVRETASTAALEAMAGVGLPCVVKPSDDTGSYEVRHCATAEEALAQIQRVLAIAKNVRGQATARTALIEEFVAAPEFSVESFTWRGQTTCVGVTEKTLTGFPHFVEFRHVFPAPLSPQATTALETTTLRALAATGFSWGAAHTELKLTAAGPVVVEINARLAGGMIPDLVLAALGVDLLEQQIKAAVGRAPDLTPTRSRRAGIQFIVSAKTGTLVSVDGVEAAREAPGVQGVVVTGRPGRPVAPPRSAYDRLGYVIVSGDSRRDVTAGLREAASRLRVIVEEEKT